MTLSISYPFDNLPDVIFELVQKVQDLGGVAIIHSAEFIDPGKLQIGQRWVRRMLSSHRSQEQVNRIYPFIQWRSDDATRERIVPESYLAQHRS